MAHPVMAMPADALTFAVIMPALLVAHNVADHWIQTDHQAGHKGAAGWPGRIACAKHVSTYTATTAATVALLWWLFALPIAWPWMVAGQLVSAATHYIADRRTPLEQLAGIIPGKANFWQLGAQREVHAEVLWQWTDGPFWSRTSTATTERPAIRVDLVDQHGERIKWDNPSLGTGAYALDQSWHWAWLFVAAVLTSL